MESLVFYSDSAAKKARIELKNTYDAGIILAMITRARREIEELNAVIGRAQEFLSAAAEHLEFVQTAQYRYAVYWERQKDKHVTYTIGVYQTPCVPNGERYKMSLDEERFEGRERKAAREFAQMLCESYGVQFKDIIRG